MIDRATGTPPDTTNAQAGTASTLAPDAGQLSARFAALKTALLAEIGETPYRSWIAPLDISAVNACTLDIAAPTRLIRDWVRSHYHDQIVSIWNRLHGAEDSIARVEVVSRRASPAAAAEAGNVVSFVRAADPAQAVVEADSDPTGLSSPLDARYTFDSLLIAPANEFAAAAAARVADGEATEYDLFNLQDRGTIMIMPGTRVFEGMIVGEHSRDNDLPVNVLKGKKLTNVRASGSDESTKLIPPRILTLEQAITFINDDEMVEVTPKTIRLRKVILDPNERKRAEKLAESA
jgi:hypothetical protein